MPAYNFKKQFASRVEEGSKRQTIRAHRKNGLDAKPGDKLYLYTGMRTKACRKLIEATCASVEAIEIHHMSVYISGRMLSAKELRDLALADGFRDATSFLSFFHKEHELPLHGVLIKW
jgi:hypothetical protein